MTTAPSVRPVLMHQDEIISLKEAVFRTGKHEKTIRRWCKQDGIGRRSAPGAPWEISATALEAKRYGDDEALELLRGGLRESPVVKRYLEAIGIN